MSDVNKEAMMATINGTERYFEKLKEKEIPEYAIHTLGKTGLKVNCIGFGGYRIYHNSVEHATALRYALLNGVNLIDTSSNYANGGSEMLIGNLTQEMYERGELSRDDIVIVSKVGYLQGHNLKMASENEKQGAPFPEMVKYLDNCWHCIHPDFLEIQLSNSLDNLQTTHLDVYLLHNPEYFLLDGEKRNKNALEELRNEYYHRIKKAFEWMEEKVGEGKIRSYGVSSNTFGKPSVQAGFTSLERLLEIAHEISADNYFQIIEFPLNLFENEAAVEKNQMGNSKTLLELAKEHNLGTLTNRPLNAMYGDDLVRLANFRTTDAKEITETFHKKLTTLQRFEKQYRDKFIEELNTDLPKETLEKLFSLSTQLNSALTFFKDWEHWDHVYQNLILPQTMNSIGYLNDGVKENKEWQKWAKQYTDAAFTLFDTISRKYENGAQERSVKLSGKLKSLSGYLWSLETLSQQALRVLSSVSGVHCVLLGMRRVAYVEDALAASDAEPVPEALDILLELN